MMNSVRIGNAMFAAFFLIICFANESLANEQRGKIGLGAIVHPEAIIDERSAVGPNCVVKKKAHLYAGANIGSHGYIGPHAEIRSAYVLDYAHVKRDAVIGDGAICEMYTIVGSNANIGEHASLMQNATLKSRAIVGSNSVVGFFSVLGRKARMEKFACVGQHSKIGARVVLAAYSIVEPYVRVPHRLAIREKEIVISTLERANALQLLKDRTYSENFHKSVDKLASDPEFESHFSMELGYILSDFKKDCENTKDKFRPQVIYLVYSYMQELLGKNKLDELIQSKPEKTDRDDHVQKTNSDCENPKHYDKFDEKIQKQILLVMALYYESIRRNRIQGEKVCQIVSEVLNNNRNVLGIKEKCGGITTAICNGCADGEATSGSYTMSDSDVSNTRFIEFDEQKNRIMT